MLTGLGMMISNMSPFDLLFIALFLSAVVAMVAAAVQAARGRNAAAILQWLAASAAAYFAIVIAVSIVAPRRELALGERQCFDDWCIAVESADRTSGGYEVALRISSRARRVSQRENNLAVYMTDARGRRYDPLPDAEAAPLNALLGPGQSVVARRRFALPPDAPRPGVVVTHEGGFPIGWLIIGYDTWFRKPPIVPLW